MQEKNLSEQESLYLITQMIQKARNVYHDTGVGAIMWGAVIAVCSLVKLSEIQFGFKLPFDIYLLSLVAVIPQVFITIKQKKERKAKSYDESYMDYIWLGFGISIFLLLLISNSIVQAWAPVAGEYQSLTGHSPAFRFNEFISPLFLMLYGMPTFVTGAACKFKPMLWGGLLCWVCCILAIYMPVKIDLLLIALSAIVAWLIPGMLMLKEYRKAKQKTMEADV